MVVSCSCPNCPPRLVSLSVMVGCHMPDVNFTAFLCDVCDLMQFGLMCREWAFFQPWILKRKWPG